MPGAVLSNYRKRQDNNEGLHEEKVIHMYIYIAWERKGKKVMFSSRIVVKP